MIVPALPEIQRTFGGDPADATWLLTAFLLTAARRDAAPRPPRRHVRQGALAADLARRVRRGLGRVRARRIARRDDRRARDPGRGRRDLPARDRDHPRRVPAREGRDRHRDDLGDVRHRRRRRPRHRRRARGRARRRVDLLAQRGRGRASPRGRRGGTSPSRPCACEARIDWVGAVLLSRRARHAAARRQRGQRVGLGLGRRARAVRRGRRLGRVWCRWERRVRRPARRPALMRRRAGVDDERRRVRDRLRDVRLVRADPAARADARRASATGSARR